MVGCATLWTLFAHWKSWGFESTWALDLALYHSAVWNLAEGNGFTNTLFPHRGDGILAQDHFEPILVLAALLYRCVPRLETLLFVQSGLLALGAWGVAKLLRQSGLSPWPTVLGALIYLLWWPIWRLAMMDIRPVMWSVPFVLLAIAALREGRLRATLVWGFLACLCREELPLFLLALGGVAWFWSGGPRRKRRRAVLGLAALCVTYLVVTWSARSNPTLHSGSFSWLAALIGQGEPGRLSEVAQSLPERLSWVGQWGFPVLVGSLAAFEALLVAAPAALFLVFTDLEWTHWNDSRTHYIAVLLPGLVAASAIGWPRLLQRLGAGSSGVKRAWLLLFLSLLSVQSFVLVRGWTLFIEPDIREGREGAKEHYELHEMIARLPADASVLTTGSVSHWVASRRSVYVVEEEEPKPELAAPPLIPRASLDPDWALLPREVDYWIDRVGQAGLVQHQELEGFLLFGPPERAPRKEAADSRTVREQPQPSQPESTDVLPGPSRGMAPEEQADASQETVSDGLNEDSAGLLCPRGMIAVEGGSYVLGEEDPSWLARFPEGQLARKEWEVSSFCVARHPFPGSPHPWFADGLVLSDLPLLEVALQSTGRRVCRVVELVLAAAGPENWRYPYHRSTRSPRACDPNDPAPDPFGSFASCVSPVGVHDFMVRSSWGRSTAQDELAAPFVVVGGLMRENTVYAPTNFGVHEHKLTDPRNFEDDGIRLCADPGVVTSAQERAWNEFMALAVQANSFEGLVGGLSDRPTD